MMLAYEAKKNKGVFLLSTLSDEPAKKKPYAILYYNQQKGAVDTADQMLRQNYHVVGGQWPFFIIFST